jgi:heme-degrading monooxygenase HmoA
MWMRVTRSHVEDPSRFDEASWADLAAAVKRLPGLQSFTLGSDRASNRAVSMSTWDTEEHARYLPGSLADALGEAMSRFEVAGLQVDSVDIAEVSPTT